jgi:CubicO group peptidase (beta-lactamase class C family)
VSGFSAARLGVGFSVPFSLAASGLLPGQFDSAGWGFGVSVVTRRTEVGKSVGSYGWDGGLGTSWFNDPVEDLTAILLTQRAWTSPVPGPVFRDFWTTAAAALAD